MWLEFHDTKGRVQIEDMTPDGLHDAVYQCQRTIEELESAARSLDPDDDEHPLDRAEREHNEDQDAGLEGMPNYQA